MEALLLPLLIVSQILSKGLELIALRTRQELMIRSSEDLDFDQEWREKNNFKARVGKQGRTFFWSLRHMAQER